MNFKVIILLLSPIFVISQNRRLFFVEGGACIIAPVTKNFFINYGDARGGYEWKGTIKSITSYYIKAGLEKPFSIADRFQLSVPITFSYLNIAERLEMDGGSWGCFAYSYGHQSIIRNNHTGDFH